MTANSFLKVIDIGNQYIKSVDSSTANSQGIMLQSHSSPGNKNDMSENRGELSKAPSNKHSEIIKGVKDRRGISKATVHRWLTALGYKYSDKEKCYYSDAHKWDDVV
eukprot:2874313-Ditylum_brightwellii.AAC.2